MTIIIYKERELLHKRQEEFLRDIEMHLSKQIMKTTIKGKNI